MTKSKEQKILEPAEDVLDKLFFVAKVSNDPDAGREIWDAASKLVIRCFMPPRGLTVLAGGNAALGVGVQADQI